MRVIRDDGVVLDASFSVADEPPSIVIESAVGRIGINARNRDYSEGLTTLLHRLAEIDAVILEIRVESLVTKHLTVNQQRVSLSRHSLPITMRHVSDFKDLKRDISRGAREPGARPDAQRGGSSRRLRLILLTNWTVHTLECRLAGSGSPVDSESMAAVVDMAAGRPSGHSGQGFLASVEKRVALEKHAMRAALAWYTSQGWACKDVSGFEAYDLECTKASDWLHVEVKGTTTSGDRVIVTRGEVARALEFHPNTELFVLADIEFALAPDGLIGAKGGYRRICPGWASVANSLTPIGFEFQLP